MRAAFILVLAACVPAHSPRKRNHTVVFGTTVVIPSGSARPGLLHQTQPDPAAGLREAEAGRPRHLHVFAQRAAAGLPAGLPRRHQTHRMVRHRLHRKVLDCRCRAVYTFNMLSDDGAKLYIDDQVIIDNDGIHPPLWKDGVGRTGRRSSPHSRLLFSGTEVGQLRWC